MKYALIIVGYALVLWGLLALRRDAARGRTDAIGERQAEIESVVEEFIAAAERAREDLKQKSTELDRMIGRADERLDRFERLTAHGQQPATASNLRTLPLPQLAERPGAGAPTSAPPAATAAPASQVGSPPAALEAVPAANTDAPAPATRGRAAAAASYEAHARAAAEELAAAGFPVDDVGIAPVDGEPAARIREAQAVRLTLAGAPARETADAPPAAEAPEKKSRKKDRSRHADVYAMADAGRGVTEIARATSLSKGEVQLILDLRKAR